MTTATESRWPTATAVAAWRPDVRHRGLASAAAGPAGAAWAVLCLLPDLFRAPGVGACTVGVVAGFAVAAVVVGEQPGRKRAGLLLAVAGPGRVVQAFKRFHGLDAIPLASGWLSVGETGNAVNKAVPILEVQPDGRTSVPSAPCPARRAFRRRAPADHVRSGLAHRRGRPAG